MVLPGFLAGGMACGLKPLVHDWYGAKALWSTRWRSIDDLRELVRRAPEATGWHRTAELQLSKLTEVIDKYQPTVFYGVPTSYAALLYLAEKEGITSLGNVRMCVSAGEPLPKPLRNRHARHQQQ